MGVIAPPLPPDGAPHQRPLCHFIADVLYTDDSSFLRYLCEYLLTRASRKADRHPASVIDDLWGMIQDPVDAVAYQAARTRFNVGDFFDSASPGCMFRLLKAFIRELPAPLVPRTFHDLVSKVFFLSPPPSSSLSLPRSLPRGLSPLPLPPSLPLGGSLLQGFMLTCTCNYDAVIPCVAPLSFVLLFRRLVLHTSLQISCLL